MKYLNIFHHILQFVDCSQFLWLTFHFSNGTWVFRNFLLLLQVVSKYWNEFRDGVEQDAQEFWIWLMEKMHEDLNRKGRRKLKVRKVSVGDLALFCPCRLSHSVFRSCLGYDSILLLFVHYWFCHYLFIIVAQGGRHPGSCDGGSQRQQYFLASFSRAIPVQSHLRQVRPTKQHFWGIWFLR